MWILSFWILPVIAAGMWLGVVFTLTMLSTSQLLIVRTDRHAPSHVHPVVRGVATALPIHGGGPIDRLHLGRGRVRA